MKYSVIVPVYNAEKTLHRCVDSILKQNFHDMELILVNDGSEDKSLEICNYYQVNDLRVKVINKTNGGVSTARNAGLDIAIGDYILFVDSDDYVCGNYFEILELLSKEFQYDFLSFSYALIKGNNVNYIISEEVKSNSSEECVKYFSEMIYNKTINSPWSKCYLRRIIETENIRFDKNLYIGEDETFNLQYMLYCNSCCVSSEVLYYVSLENADSLSRKIRPDFYQQLELLNVRKREIIRKANIPSEHKKQYEIAENLIQLREVYSEAKRMHLTGKKISFRRNIISKMCKENNQEAAPLPSGMFSKLLQIPVRLKLVTMIDAMGWYLARR